jgi:hypothetical protein
MSILVKGLNSYRNGDSIYVKTIKRYGYSKNSKEVVAEVEDLKGRSIYIDFSGKEPEALFQINILKDKFAPKGYKWIDLTNANSTGNIYVLRNWAAMLSIITAITIIIILLRGTK